MVWAYTCNSCEKEHGNIAPTPFAPACCSTGAIQQTLLCGADCPVDDTLPADTPDATTPITPARDELKDGTTAQARDAPPHSAPACCPTGATLQTLRCGASCPAHSSPPNDPPDTTATFRPTCAELKDSPTAPARDASAPSAPAPFAPACCPTGATLQTLRCGASCPARSSPSNDPPDTTATIRPTCAELKDGTTAPARDAPAPSAPAPLAPACGTTGAKWQPLRCGARCPTHSSPPNGPSDATTTIRPKGAELKDGTTSPARDAPAPSAPAPFTPACGSTGAKRQALRCGARCPAHSSPPDGPSDTTAHIRPTCTELKDGNTAPARDTPAPSAPPHFAPAYTLISIPTPIQDCPPPLERPLR